VTLPSLQHIGFLAALSLAAAVLWPPAASAEPAPPPDESVLGEIVVTGTSQEHVTTLGVLPSLSLDMEDVTVRAVVRRDLELSGMFHIIPDRKAPPGEYNFESPVDVAAWQRVGAEVVVKVAARKSQKPKLIDVLGLAYFLSVGKDPVYQQTFTVAPADVRVTAHRITDALLGAITGRPGGFASHFTYSARWGRDYRIMTMDADGHDLKPVTPQDLTAIAPAWGPDNSLFYPQSINYAPFTLMRQDGTRTTQIRLPFRKSVYSVSLNKDYTKMAVAVAEDHGGTSIYVGKPDGSGMTKVSETELSTHPVFSPSGKLAWIGGKAKQGTQRVWVDGKPVSPAGFTAAAPTFCDTEDGIRLVYAVAVGGNRQDLVISAENGQGIARLTQNQGTNTYPACSTDGRLLAFFSTRNEGPGMYMMSLKRWTTLRVTSQLGQSLRWAPLPKPASAR
jgi:TolB protein